MKTKNTYDKFFSRQLENTITRIKKDLTGNNQAKLIEYIEFLSTEEKKSDARVISLSQRIIHFCRILNKPLTKADKQDAISIVKYADSQTWTERSKSDFKAMYKQYRKWLTGNEDFPQDVKWIQRKVLYDDKKQEEVLPDDIMKVEDYQKFINACDHPRDKALFGIIGELGLRPKEALMMKIKNINFDDPEVCIVTIPADTKTGSRTVPCIYSKKWLREWTLKYHPYRDNKESWLFTQIQRDKDKALSYKGLSDRFNEIAKRTELKTKFKKFTLYQFRKFSYTFKATKGWSDQQIKAFHGLDPKSKAIDVYVKIDPQELTDIMKEMYGLKVRKVKGKGLIVVTCPNCAADNPEGVKNCEECGLLFDITEANKLLVDNQKKENEMAELKEQMKQVLKTMAKIPKLDAALKIKDKEASK